MTLTLDDILARLASVRPSAHGWTARCPSHPDTHASLSLALGAGAVPALVRQVTTLQRQRDHVAAELATLRTGSTQLPGDLRPLLERRLADWREAMHRNVQQARQLLRRLLVGRIVFTPVPEGVEFVAQVALGNVLAGLASPQSLVSRPGHSDDSALEVRGVIDQRAA